MISTGSCWLDVKGQRTWLSTGQAILMPYGDSHNLGGKESAPIVPLSAVVPPPPWYDVQSLRSCSISRRCSILTRWRLQIGAQLLKTADTP